MGQSLSMGMGLLDCVSKDDILPLRMGADLVSRQLDQKVLEAGVSLSETKRKQRLWSWVQHKLHAHL